MKSQLPFWKKTHPELVQVHSQVLQNVAKRVELAFDAFFRRGQAGEKPGYPPPKPDPDNPGVFLPNGAAAKSGLNKTALQRKLQRSPPLEGRELSLEQSLGQETAASYEARDYLKANAK